MYLNNKGFLETAEVRLCSITILSLAGHFESISPSIGCEASFKNCLDGCVTYLILVRLLESSQAVLVYSVCQSRLSKLYMANTGYNVLIMPG